MSDYTRPQTFTPYFDYPMSNTTMSTYQEISSFTNNQSSNGDSLMKTSLSVNLIVLLLTTFLYSCSSTTQSSSNSSTQLPDLGTYVVQVDTLMGQSVDDSTSVILTKNDFVILEDSTSVPEMFLVRFGTSRIRVSRSGLRSTSSTDPKKVEKKETTRPNRVIYTGPRGGKYYIDDNGKKVYISK